MHLVVDIGNSNIVLAIWNGKSWSNQTRVETKQIQPQVFYERAIVNMFLEQGITRNEVNYCSISSVVPDLNEKIEIALTNLLNIEIFRITPEVLTNLNMHIPHPYVIGSDLVSNAYAAYHKYSQKSLIIDFGTALTFTMVDGSNGIKGVSIMPGLKTAISSLFANTAQLPEVPLILPESSLGHDTTSAIQSGILWGYVGAVKELISRVKSEFGVDLKVIATGGLSEILKPLEAQFDVVDKDLTLHGILLIHNYYKNIKYINE